MTLVKFYLIRHRGEPVYVGSTTTTLHTRLEQHFAAVLQRKNCKLYKAMLNDPNPDQWTISLLEQHHITDTPSARRMIETRLKKKYKTNGKLNEVGKLCT